ncbi:hypothetical protein FDC35_16210 [Clostridium botulinum]|nr:hypothetical protein [Clostridium botulinum]NFP02379.1 hypothetical protein [Clostridium botulinum]
MKRKRRGSSLITVVIIFSILITVGTATLSMTVGDYKMRVKESKRIENLYGADSGLDVSYDIIVKTFDEAVKFGDFKARQLKDENCSDNLKEGPKADEYKKAKEDLKMAISDINKKHDKTHKSGTGKCSCKKEKKELQDKFDAKVEQLSKEEFNRCFKVFLCKKFDECQDKENIPENIMVDSLNSHSYLNMRLEDKSITKDKAKNFDDKKIIDFKLNTTKEKNLKDDEKHEPELSSEIEEENGKETYLVRVTSKFKSKDANISNIGEDKKELQAIYAIYIPKYDDINFKDSIAPVKRLDIIDHKQIIVGGNMNIQGEDSYNKVNLNINGDVFVQGNKKSVNDKVYDKYKGGISVNNSNVKFNGDVSTASTFLIQDNADVDINPRGDSDGNLYALNVYAGKMESSKIDPSKIDSSKYANEFSGESALNINNGSIVVDNDLALKAYNTKIKIKNFYGLNDKNISKNQDSGALERTASSIIVNGNRNSEIKITNSAYIMGVAHIDDPRNSSKYTTGESTAVKGNYIAYAEAENDPYDVSKYKDVDLKDKVKIFENFWGSDGRKEIVDTGGIELPEETYAPGVIVYWSGKSNVVRSGKNLSNNLIDFKRSEYAKKVYNLNQSAPKEDNKYFENLYTEMLTNEKDIIYNVMNLYNMDEEYIVNGNENKAIFNNDEKPIVIMGKDSKGISNRKDVHEIDASNGELNAFIATNGDVIIDGKISLNGNIITEGNLFIQGNGEKTLEYNQKVIDEIYNKNIELFNKVFENGDTDEKVPETFLNVEYDLDRFIKNKLWKIIK